MARGGGRTARKSDYEVWTRERVRRNHPVVEVRREEVRRVK